MEKLLDRLGRTTAAHPWRTIGIWLVVAAALVLVGQSTGGRFVNDFRVPGVESQRAADLARAHFPEYGAASADVVLHGDLREPAAAAAFAGWVRAVQDQPDVTAVDEPIYSPDGRTAVSSVRYGREFGELTPAAYERLDAAAEPMRSEGVTVDFRGFVVDLAFEPETGPSELLGVGAALLVLLVAFGSVVAAGLPILVAVAGLAVGTALVLLTGSIVDIPAAAPIVAVMLGLGAGIDYALFVVTRFRAALADDLAPVAAAGRAVATAGHAVVFAAATVVVAILGLMFTGIPFVGAMGLAGALTVSATAAAALTLLPALFGLLGRRIGRRRWRSGAPARWARWAARVDRHRVPYALAAIVALLAIAAPVLALRLGTPDDGNQPSAWPQRRAYDRVATAFGPGWNGPLVVAVTDGPAERLAAALAADPEVAVVAPPQPSPDGAVTLLTVVPRHAPQDAQVADLVHRIRTDLAPDAGTTAAVGGTAAFMIDLADSVAERLPWVVTGVILAAALLLLAMFRAPVVAVKAAVMAALSVGAAYGVIVAVFQWGWGLGLLGVDQPVPIMSVVPMLLFAVLFGLSMDYEVFLLASIKEAYDEHGDPRRAVSSGLAATGGVITAAATIMAVVFLSFVMIDDVLVKMIGVGLAVAVLVDATLIRVVLAPAVMGLLGHRAWPRRGHPPSPATPTPTAAPDSPILDLLPGTSDKSRT